MHDALYQRLVRKIESLPDEQIYQVLDFIEFLESKYSKATPVEASGLQKFAENLEDKLRRKAVSPNTIREAFQLISAADRVVSSVSEKGKRMFSGLSTALDPNPRWEPDEEDEKDDEGSVSDVGEGSVGEVAADDVGAGAAEPGSEGARAEDTDAKGVGPEEAGVADAGAEEVGVEDTGGHEGVAEETAAEGTAAEGTVAEGTVAEETPADETGAGGSDAGGDHRRSRASRTPKEGADPEP